MQYSLNIIISPADTAKIEQAGQKVTLVKSVVTSPAGSSALACAWLALEPLPSVHVTWTEEYFMYASRTKVEDGAVIEMSSSTPDKLLLGSGYSFRDYVFTAVPSSPGKFTLFDHVEGTWTFGLAQKASIGGDQPLPLNAVPVLYNESAAFIPQEKLSIYLSGTKDNGTVRSEVQSDALVVSLDSERPSASIGFDGATNTFYLKT